jgi:hypothetical protein
MRGADVEELCPYWTIEDANALTDVVEAILYMSLKLPA